MQYIEVLVSSQRYRGNDPLTYASAEKISVGQVVSAELGNSEVLGLVVKATPKPSFKTKEITRVISDKPLDEKYLGLLNWIRQYYPAPLGAITALFLPAGLLHVPRTIKTKPGNDRNQSLPVLPKLNKEQQDVIDSMHAQKDNRSILLHGATGTGKTRVYMELAKEQLKAGKSVLVLTPEISLTPQLTREFENAFAENVIVLHSKLTNAQRRTAWLNIHYSSHPVIVIGPRSALFAPYEQLGLIVVDEAHEQAYKQEQMPYYDARRVASKLAQLHSAQLVFGTGTPNISEYYLAESRKAPILRMQKLAVGNNHGDTDIQLVLSRDKQQFTRNAFLSDELLDGIQDALNKQEQSLVFLNRRGTARLLLCQVCGWQATCPNCDLPLTYHGDSHLLRCHTCGLKQKAVTRCPDCGSTDIIFRSAGTKSVEDTIKKLFPKARIQRFDTDNLTHERFEEHFTRVSRGEVDILIGTQLLAKGLDLPRLGFVGVVSADTSLHFPDYTSEERTYQLLRQVIGRVGRGHRGGKAIIQTYYPDSPAVVAASTNNWDTFYEAELAERKQFNFPPFCHLLKISCSRKTQSGARTAIERLAEDLRSHHENVEIIGPNPSFFEKKSGKYNWQLVVKAKNRSDLIRIILELPANYTYDIDPSNLL